MADKLLPCPFCGGEAKYFRDTLVYGNPQHMIFCTKCGSRSYAHDSKEECTEAWNNRSNWHTGTPTKDDWYFVMWKDTEDNCTRFSALMWNNYNKTWYDDYTPDWNWCDVYHAEVIAWMQIPPFKGEKDITIIDLNYNADGMADMRKDLKVLYEIPFPQKEK